MSNGQVKARLVFAPIRETKTLYTQGRYGYSTPSGLALLLATVPEEDFDEAQDAFLEDEALLSLLAVDRRVVV